MSKRILWISPTLRLQVGCIAVEYGDYPVIEWTVYFKNLGTNNTPILENVPGLDTAFERGPQGEFLRTESSSKLNL